MAETAPMKTYVGERKMRKIPVPKPKPQRAQGQHRSRKSIEKGNMVPSYVKPEPTKSKQKKDFTR
jgi:hypothetical protein